MFLRIFTYHLNSYCFNHEDKLIINIHDDQNIKRMIIIHILRYIVTSVIFSFI
jgi:hypothetical protein